MRNRPAFREDVSPTAIASFGDFVAPGFSCDSEQVLTALAQSPRLGFGIIDRDLRFQFVNKALAAMHGMEPKAMLGKTLRQLLGTAADPLEAVARRVFTTGQFLSVWRIAACLPQGRTVQLLDNFPLKGVTGGVQQIAGVILDVSGGSGLETRLDQITALTPSKNSAIVHHHPALRFALSVALFQGLENNQADIVLSAARSRQAVCGEYLCRQGERSDKLYLLKKGLVKVVSSAATGREVLLRWERPGDVFGLGTFARRQLSNTWSALAAQPSEVMEWDRAAIEQLCMTCPGFCQNAVWIALRWAHELQNRVEQMATEQVDQRLARVITDFSEHAVSGAQAIELHVSDEELAQMVGTTIFTVSKVLSRWKRFGYIQKGRKRLLILQPPALLHIATGDMHLPVEMPQSMFSRGSEQLATSRSKVQ
ncbi:MAG: helix-turn-helix domain-containing protein [Acidobacteria bacterium]|nr:helix-turn-helix domain-containing protein [Acidobacteriota bacterium]